MPMVFIADLNLIYASKLFNDGFLGIEFDVRKTKDNNFVICHDAFIDRVSNGAGLLSNYTYNELLKFNFGSKEVPSKIPLLSDVLKKFNGIKLVELKTRIDLEPILDLIDDNTYFMSFDTTFMFELKKKYPNLKFGVLNYVLNSKKDYNLDMICLLNDVVTDRLVNHFLGKKIRVFIYGITGNAKYISDKVYYITDKKNIKKETSI